MRNASRFAQQTVKGARNFCDVKLDYSPSSVRKVDKIIGQFRREGPDVEDVAETLFGLGCYVGEVFVRNAGGKWKADPPSPFGLVIRLDKDSFCDPIAKAFKRFENGAGDSLAYFYQCFAEMTHGED